DGEPSAPRVVVLPAQPDDFGGARAGPEAEVDEGEPRAVVVAEVVAQEVPLFGIERIYLGHDLLPPLQVRKRVAGHEPITAGVTPQGTKGGVDHVAGGLHRAPGTRELRLEVEQERAPLRRLQRVEWKVAEPWENMAVQVRHVLLSQRGADMG